MADTTPTVLGVPIDTQHILMAMGGAAVAAALLPAGVVIGGLTLGATEIGALGGFLAGGGANKTP
jgi:hypothetical protein